MTDQAAGLRRDDIVAVVSRELLRLAQASGPVERGQPRPMTALYAAVIAAAGPTSADDRAALLLACARAMRLLVVEHMRTPRAHNDPPGSVVLAVHDLLVAIERVNARLVQVVEGLYFAALPVVDLALALGIEPADAVRDWQRARTWLIRELPAYSPAAPEHEISVANAAWVDAVFDDALTLGPEGRVELLERCAAVSPNLRRDVDELLRGAEQPLDGFEPGALTAALLWDVLGAAPVQPALSTTAGPPEPVLPSEPTLPVQDQAPATEQEPERELPGAARVLGATAAAALNSLRHMTHANIARVVDVRVGDDGRTYAEFERIDGRPIDRYCDEARLTIDQRLDLFLDVCAAVQYGHRKLVAHGALEPSTVLVTSAGEVKVLDFGAAFMAAAGAGSATGPHGSPEYLAPEQVRGEPTTVAVDVYRLGLLLYELLTGERAQPAGATNRESLEGSAGAARVPPPSARARRGSGKSAAARRTTPRRLARALRGDLDAIVMYALRKEPDRRYPSVTALRSDVQRHRARLPIWVRSDSAAYRARTFLVRHRFAAAALLAAVGAGALLAPASVRERLRRTQESARVENVEQVLGDVLGAAGHEFAAPNAVQFVDQSARMARTELAAEPRSQARLLTTIGRAYAALGHYDRSIEALEEALALRRSQFGDDSLEVADTLEALARSEHLTGRYDESEAGLRSVLAVRQVRAGGGHPSTLATAIELGAVLQSRGQLHEAEQLLRGSVTRLRAGVVTAGGAVGGDRQLPRALSDLASVLRDRGLPGEAAAIYREALALLKGADRDGGADLPLARIGYAQLLIGRAELDQAEAELAEALPALRRAHQGEHPALAEGAAALAQLRMEQGRLAEARTLLADALRVREQWLGRLHPLVPRSRALEAELALRAGQGAEAIGGASRALDELERLGLEHHPAAIDARLTLGEALIGSGQYDEAVRVLAAGLSSAERLFVKFDPRIARLQAALSRAASLRQ